MKSILTQRIGRLFLIVLALLTLTLVLKPSQSAQAETITCMVTDPANSADTAGTLNYWLAAVGADGLPACSTITFSGDMTALGPILISHDVIIDGETYNVAITGDTDGVDNQNLVTVGIVDNPMPNPTAALKNLTLTSGAGGSYAPVQNYGTLTLDHVRVVDNRGTSGSIFNLGTLDIFNSTFSTSDTSYNNGILNAGTLNVEGTTFSSNAGSILNTTFGGTYSPKATITDSTFVNSTSLEGIIWNDADWKRDDNGEPLYGVSGTLVVTNSTFYGNTTSNHPDLGYVVVIAIRNEGSLTLTNNTFANNQGPVDSFTLYSDNRSDPTSTIQLFNNVFVEAADPDACAYNFYPYLTGNVSNNLFTGFCGRTDIPAPAGFTLKTPAEINLGSLGSYGGSTQTIPLLPGSAAIDAADASACPAADQRGVTRPQGAGCDIGAYEMDYVYDPTDDFVITVKTDNYGTSSSTKFTIPTFTGETYNYNVDCNNDGKNEAAAQTGNYTCDYAAAGTYTVRIQDNTGLGTGFPRIYFSYGGDRLKLLTIEQWGKGKWTSMNRAFSGCLYLSGNATDTPDLSGVTDMSYMFSDARTFNGNISNWNTGNVTNMSLMFAFASAFNQPIGSWNTASVTNMSGMFFGASAFNQDIGRWDTANVANMYYMFKDSSAFNQNLGAWEVRAVTHASDMLTGTALSTANYDALLNGWAAQTVQPNVLFGGGNNQYCAGKPGRDSLTARGWRIYDRGYNCPAENDFVITVKTDNLGISGPTQFTIPTFTGETYNYNVDCNDDGAYEVTGATGNYTCDYAAAGTYTVRIQDNTGLGTGFPRIYIPFNINLADSRKLMTIEQWGTGKWTSMNRAFYGCSNLTGNASDTPDLSGVTDMSSMFAFTGAFNQDISSWDTGNVTRMVQMFYASAFNQDISGWDTGKVTSMFGMFRDAYHFNQDLNAWNTASVTDMGGMFENATAFNGNISNWDTGNVTSMNSMFVRAYAFNQPIGNWNTTSVTGMYHMFTGASAFNQDISRWNTASVTSMGCMFCNASAFNQNLGAWKVSAVTNASDMLYGAALSTANYDALLNGWAAQTVQSGVYFGSGNTTYCAGEAARASLVAQGWTITDGGACLPVLAVISPAAAPVGSGDLSLTVTGSGLMTNSVVRWNGTDLATTYVSPTQLSALIPAASLASVQTAQITVYTPAPGGGTSNVLAFFVTQAAAGVTSQDVASGTDPSASVTPATASASGDGLLVVAEYDANPGGTPSFNASGTYFDVYAAPGSTFSQVNITACDLNGGNKLYWWDGAKWVKAEPQSYDAASGCVTLIVTDTSSPSLSQLQGTFFAAGTDWNTAPVANPGGPYLAAINTAIAFDGSLSSDADGNPLSYAWNFGDGSTGTGAMLAHSYAATGVYNACLTVNDGAVDSAQACTMAVVYDPSAGFVTGGGWIDSQPGAYKPDKTLSGKATFGFVSKYLKGATVPTGNTEFQFQAASFKFHSTAYEWLVVSKDQVTAQFKGSGMVNGALDPNGNVYKFMLWAGDGSPDTFRIRIWWEDAGGEHDVYDNGFNQAIGGGSIVVHTSK